MKFPWLKSALDGEGPFLSIYFDTTRTNENAATEITNRWQHLRDRLESENAPKQLLDRIEDSLLRPSPIGGDHGRAIIASGDDLLIDRVLPAPPREDAGHYGDRPLLLPMMQLTPHAVRQLLIEVDRAGADLHLRYATDPSITNNTADLGDEASVEGGHDELHKTNKTGATRNGWRGDNYEARVEDSWERNAEAVAAQVNKLVLKHDPHMVLLTGDVRAQSLLKDNLRQEVTGRLYEIQGGARGENLSRDAFRRSLGEITEEFSDAKQRDLAEQYQERQARDGTSVGGVGEIDQSLDRGQVEELLFIVGREPDNIEELLYKALTTDAGIEALDDGIADLLDGVGALLRWRDDATASNSLGSMGGDRGRIDAVDPTRDDSSPRAEEEAAIRES